MSQQNPFAYPAGMSWLPYMAHSAPGAMLWLPMKRVDGGDKAFTFILREESTVISSLPKLPSGGVPLEWRMGMLAFDVSSGNRVPMIVAIVKTPGGISEVTINALHLDGETLEMLADPIVMIFIGDSGSVERTVMFPQSKALSDVLHLGRQIYEKHPWTDPDFDEAKKIFEKTVPLDELWEQMKGR